VPPRGDTWCWGWLALGVSQARAPMWRYLALGLACPTRELGPRPHVGHLMLGLPCLCAGLAPRAHMTLGLTCHMPKANGSCVRT